MFIRSRKLDSNLGLLSPKFMLLTLHYFMFMSKAPFLLLFSCSVVSNSLQPHGQQHARLPRPSPSPRACSNSGPSNQWCHPTSSPSVVPFSSCLHSFPGSFPMSQLFASSGQSIGASASASVPPMNIQDWFALGLTGLISLLSKGLSGVFRSINSSVFNLLFMVQLSHPYMTTSFD